MAPRPSSPIISYRPAFVTVVIAPTIFLFSPLSALSAPYTHFLFFARIRNLYREAKTHRLAHGGPIVHSTHQIFGRSTLRGYQCFALDTWRNGEAPQKFPAAPNWRFY